MPDVSSTALDALVAFRRGLYATFTAWPDALFELADAALCATGPVSSVPTLSLEPEFRRSHGSLYKALAKGRIDEERFRRLLEEHRPSDWPMVFAVDASTFERCDAECSPERGFYYSASKHSAGQPIVAGWHYQWICQLSWAFDSWTAPLDICRIAPLADPTNATVDQVRRLVGLLPSGGEVPLFVFDAGYDPIATGHDLSGCRAQVLCRIRDDRVFYADAPPRPNRPPKSGGRPPRHGKRSKCFDPLSWPEPSARLAAADPRYGTVSVTAWHGMHPRLSGRGHWSGLDRPPIVKGSVLRVDVEHLPKPSSRAKKTLWLWWSGEGEPDLDRCWRAYLRRFDIEHTFRHVKQTFGWTTPKLANARAGRSLDPACRCRVQRATSGAWPRRGPSPPLGATPRSVVAHTCSCAKRVSTTSCHTWHTSQPTETFTGRTRTAERDAKTPKNPLSGGQKGRVSPQPGFNCKLRTVSTISGQPHPAHPASWVASVHPKSASSTPSPALSPQGRVLVRAKSGTSPPAQKIFRASRRFG